MNPDVVRCGVKLATTAAEGYCAWRSADRTAEQSVLRLLGEVTA